MEKRMDPGNSSMKTVNYTEREPIKTVNWMEQLFGMRKTVDLQHMNIKMVRFNNSNTQIQSTTVE